MPAVLAGVLPSLVVAWYSFRRTSGPAFQDGFGLQSYARVRVTDALAYTAFRLSGRDQRALL